VGVGQLGPHLGGADLAVGHRHPVVIQLGPNALHPLGALVDQGLVQPYPFSPLQHRLGRYPRFGQIAALQQLPQQPGIGAVRLGMTFPSPGGHGVGGLGHMSNKPRGGDLLDHIPPAVQPSTASSTDPPLALEATSSASQRRKR
jgi:hypothetical protein